MRERCEEDTDPVLNLRSLQVRRRVGSEFSLENEVFKPFFCGQTVGKYVTFVAATAATRISLRPLPDH